MRMLNAGRWLWIVGGLLLAMGPGARAEDLPRKGMLGAALEPGEGGVRVREVLNGTAAEEAGLKAGDVLVKLGDEALAAPADVVRLLGTRRAGEEIELAYQRGEDAKTARLVLRGRPLETGDGYEVEYGTVTSRGARLRTIVTRPQGEGRRPALLIIQGLGCFSVDNPAGPLTPYKEIPATLTRAGIVTMRVEKPGMGDSEGGPCSEIDFETELDGYRQALAALRARGDVDPEEVYLFGHSMGGVMAPILAAETPVRGVAVYGTALKSWTEYLLENTRRQMVLAGAPYAEIDDVNRLQARYLHHLAVERKSPNQIKEEHPDLAAYVAETAPDGVHEFGRHYQFFQQLHDLNLAKVWGGVDAHVLAVWGESDFVSGADDHQAIAAIVNVAHSGKGVYRSLPGNDHGFSQAETPAASLSAGGSGEYDPAFAEALVAWIQATRGT